MTARTILARLRAAWLDLVVLVPTLLALLMYVGLFARSMLRQLTLEHLIALLFLWQTQTGTAFAIAAALIGAIAIMRQTTTTERREEKRRERRAAALRAMLLHDLFELSDYTVTCVDVLADLHARLKANRDYRTACMPVPPIPGGAVNRVTELIEVGESDHERPLVILMRRSQIQHARMRFAQRRVTDPDVTKPLVTTDVAGFMVDTAEIHARCDKLFDYARGDAHAPATAISPDDVKASLFLICRDFPDLGDLERIVANRAERGERGSPWPAV